MVRETLRSPIHQCFREPSRLLRILGTSEPIRFRTLQLRSSHAITLGTTKRTAESFSLRTTHGFRLRSLHNLWLSLPLFPSLVGLRLSSLFPSKSIFSQISGRVYSCRLVTSRRVPFTNR